MFNTNTVNVANPGLTSVPGSVTGGVFVVGTSGTQLPNSAGLRHQLRLLQSSTPVFIAGVATVNSGTGFVLAGDPATNLNSELDINLSNLNMLYGIGMNSSLVTYVTANY